VAKNRKMTAESVEAIAQGRVWTGLEAQKNGLVDRVGGLHDAIMVARELAKIGPEDEADVVEYSPRGLFKLDLPTPTLSAPLSSLGTLAMFDLRGAVASAALFGGENDADDDTPYLGDYDLTYLRQLARYNGRAQCLLPPDFLPRDGAAPRPYDVEP